MEEVSPNLLSAEMMRGMQFFAWMAGDCGSKTNTEGWGVMSEVHIEGYAAAYAERQAALYQSLRQYVISICSPISYACRKL